MLFTGADQGPVQGNSERHYTRNALEIGYDNFLTEFGRDRSFSVRRQFFTSRGTCSRKRRGCPGTDGRRMAKSYGNAIWLSDPPDEIRKKFRNMITDPQRQRRTDPGRPEVCPVFAWHKLFSPPETIAWSDHGCRTAGIGCIECKRPWRIISSNGSSRFKHAARNLRPVRSEFGISSTRVTKRRMCCPTHHEARPQRDIQVGRGASKGK